MTSQPRAISLPRAPEPQKKASFPILATVAPVVAALAIWVFTHSPFAMVFALLGPVVAVASLGDSRRRARVDVRRERERFERDLAAAIHAVDGAHECERKQLERHAPSAVVLVTSPLRNSERWRSDISDDLPIRVGTGRVDSKVQLQDAHVVHSGETSARAIANLINRAGELEGAPITVDALLSIGVCGTGPQVLAVANALVVQLAHALSPREFGVTWDPGSTGGLEWVPGLPHSNSAWTEPPTSPERTGREGCARVAFRDRGGGRSVVLATAAKELALPPECRVVVQATGSMAHLVRHPGEVSSECFTPEFVSDCQARAFVEVLNSAADSLFGTQGHPLVKKVALGALNQPRARDRRSLIACIGVGANGDVVIDLAGDGPHAIVGGTTGSGKSELLVTWVLAMATVHCASDVNFLLIDFKGGSAFSAIAELPHTVGMLTDLDESAAHRAILSLRAELRRRERILAKATARSIDDLHNGVDLARLVIIVDEFATLTAQLPELHELFADLAARGRSLGIHLILCTQRPAATVRDAVLANCSLRVSLRVTNKADSVAVIGTSGAAQLPRHSAGRALIARGDGEPELVQFAIASTEAVAEILSCASLGGTRPHRPWLDPLPSILLPSEVPSVQPPAIAFGLTDIPEEQRRSIAFFDPVAQGNLMVLGGHRSGKTGVLATLAHGSAKKLIVPNTVAGAWDVVSEMLDAVREENTPTLVLLDDVDELLGMFPPEHEPAFIDRLCRLAREGPRAGITLVLSAGVIRSRLQSVSALCESTLLLRMPSKQDHVFAGGIPSDYLSDLSPGGGIWCGNRVQVMFDETPFVTRTRPVEELTVAQGTRLAVVSSRPASIRVHLERCATVTMIGSASRQVDELSVGADTAILLGDPDSWQAAWGVLASLKATARLAFHECPVSDFRALTRSRELPLPVDSSDTLVVLDLDGRMFRAALPS